MVMLQQLHGHRRDAVIWLGQRPEFFWVLGNVSKQQVREILWIRVALRGIAKKLGVSRNRVLNGNTIKKPKFQTSDDSARSRESESPAKQTSSG
jgi:hypothetical protein